MLLRDYQKKQGTMAQTPNGNAFAPSCNSSQEENDHFLYFSFLNEDDDDDNDAQTAWAKRELKEFSKLPPPLGLRLAGNNAASAVQQIEGKLNNGAAANKKNQVEKFKAVHMQMCSLMIDFYLVKAQYPSHLVAKFYYAKRKLVWEILDKGLKQKIEIQWDNISAIRASIEEHKPGRLEIELESAPLFFRESTPQPRKHTVWTTTSDFTRGCASSNRRHLVLFPPGVLDQHYPNLLKMDRRLLELSRAPFPRFQSAYFDSYNLDEGITTTHIHFGHGGSRTTPISALPLVSTQQAKLHGNAMPLPLSAIVNNDLTSMSSATQQQPTFDMPLISTQRVQPYDNTMPLSNTISQSFACEQFAFGLPAVSTQQGRLYENTMEPLSAIVINGSTSLSSGITYEEINNQPLQDPILATCNPGVDYETSISSQFVACEMEVQCNGSLLPSELPTDDEPRNINTFMIFMID